MNVWKITGDENQSKEIPDYFDDHDMTSCGVKKRKNELKRWSDEIQQISFILIRYRYIFKEYKNTEELKKKISRAENLENDFDDFINQMSYYYRETDEQKKTRKNIRTRLTMVKNDYDEFLNNYDEFLNRRRKRHCAYKINSNERRRKRQRKEFPLLNKIKF
tara:strand:+ start:161 stop:646 length:486 start_codon:yes stop_codon:yes gene_type:complete